MRTKIPESPIHFSGDTNFFGPKNEFTSHQFETGVLESPMSFYSLEPPNRGFTTVKFLRRVHPCFRICELAERGTLGVESSQSRVSVGSTCLSVTKVPPDYVEHIPPILSGHPVTVSRDEGLSKLLIGTYMRVY